jgi:hypothetical protein
MTTLREFAWGDADYMDFCRLRQDWLRAPLGLDLNDDNLDAEKTQRLFGVYEDDALIGGAAVLKHHDGSAQLRQMIVVPNFQRHGCGRLLMQHIEAAMYEAAVDRMFLLARLVAEDFYARCGYARVGDEFTHVTIPHVRMEKTLQSRDGDMYVRSTTETR